MIGGVYGIYNFLPFIVEIFVNLNSTASHNCAGSLISYDWVLTAAHCVYKNPLEKLYLGAGRVTNTYKRTQHGQLIFDFGQTRRVKNGFYHKQFDVKTLMHDIGLLKPSKPFIADHTVSPVSLPLKTEEVDLSEKFQYCYTGGWGKTGPNNILFYDHQQKNWTYNIENNATKTLMHAVLPLISNKQCRRLYYADMKFRFDVEDTQICTLYYPGRKALCRGDSGGPLICGSKQYGITTWSYSCGAPRIGADVYTRVDKYIDWINKTLDKVNNNPMYEPNKKSIMQILEDLPDFEHEESENDTETDIEIRRGITGRSSRNVALVFVLCFHYILVVFIM